MEGITIFTKWRKTNGFIMAYVLIISSIIFIICGMCLAVNNYINNRNINSLELLELKYEVETSTCFVAANYNVVQNVGLGFIEYDQYYQYKVEKNDGYYTIYGVNTKYPKLIYYQKFNSNYTINKSYEYVIYEEGYLFE